MRNPTVIGILNRFIGCIDKVLALFLGALTGCLAVGVILTVILRYLFGISFAWAEEMLTTVFIATTFFGAALGLREKEHIAITLFFEKSSPTLRRFLNVLGMVVMIVVSIFVFKYSRQWISKVGKVPSPATGIPNGIFYTMVPVSFLITIFYAVVHILSEFITIDPPITKSRFDEDVGASSDGRGER